MATAGLDLPGMAALLKQVGFPVWAVDARNSQVELSACAGADGRWRLAAEGDFGRECGGGAAAVSTAGMSPPQEEARACVRDTRGPPCAGATDCLAAPGCIRCARSGFCTDQPLPQR